MKKVAVSSLCVQKLKRLFHFRGWNGIDIYAVITKKSHWLVTQMIPWKTDPWFLSGNSVAKIYECIESQSSMLIFKELHELCFLHAHRQWMKKKPRIPITWIPKTQESYPRQMGSWLYVFHLHPILEALKSSLLWDMLFSW